MFRFVLRGQSEQGLASDLQTWQDVLGFGQLSCQYADLLAQPLDLVASGALALGQPCRQ
ncbi:hypothetical protein [Kitasatospora sp. MAP5-34]|uniref:hypothetical protein n=1 Tax=Kitasatospora sp. MAP5-34 TaxID=3035102 RepID=UPI002475D3F5|nr:hypothetical protein [Kitasatospora sp. MAP5-34]MDH6575294.1 hypothetical protein [Kitasatospora sp. MAP5-34]